VGFKGGNMISRFETIDKHTDLLIEEDGTCFFQRYPSKEVSVEKFDNEEEARRAFNLGVVEWV